MANFFLIITFLIELMKVIPKLINGFKDVKKAAQESADAKAEATRKALREKGIKRAIKEKSTEILERMHRNKS